MNNVTNDGGKIMGQNKRYFWFKLFDDFFQSKRIKKLRNLAGGDTYTIIYLKMQLKALKTDGYLYFDGVMNDFAEELALDIDENPDDVKVTIQYLLSVGLIESSESGEEWYLTYMKNCIGSETASAQRVREHRQRKKEEKLLQCNTNETQVKQVGSAEKEIEIDKEINKKKNTKEKVFLKEYNFSDSEIVQSAFNDFLAMRIAKKCPMTERAVLQLKKKLEGMSKDEYTQADILDQSTFKTWTDIYPLKPDFVSIRERQKKSITPKQEEDEMTEEERIKQLEAEGVTFIN